MLHAPRALVGLALIAAGGVVAGSPAAPAASLCQVPVPTGGQLTAIAARAAHDVWAAGTCTGGAARQTLIEHWNGKAWKRVPSPNPGGLAQFNYLNGVVAVSASDAWAVGQTGTEASPRTLILHWNGRAWRRVPSPNPSRLPNNLLNAVTATSASNAWAVGPEILHWNGTAWRHVPFPVLSPNSSQHILTGVAALSAANVWAAGWQWSTANGWRTLIVHWNGRSWKVVPSPNPNPVPARLQVLQSITAYSRSDAWAAGFYSNSGGSNQTLLEHWNGKNWHIVPSPDPGGPAADNELAGVAMISPHLAWASGSYLNSGPIPGSDTLILRWNGSAWKLVHTPNPGSGRYFNSIAALAVLSPSNAWAAGTSNDGDIRHTLILHWNGSIWRRVASP